MKKTERIEIMEFWYQAGKRFRWNGSTLGVGIDMKKIRKAIIDDKDLEISVAGKYKKVIDPAAIMEFADNNDSFYNAKGNKLAVFQWEAFE